MGGRPPLLAPGNVSGPSEAALPATKVSPASLALAQVGPARFPLPLESVLGLLFLHLIRCFVNGMTSLIFEREEVSSSEGEDVVYEDKEEEANVSDVVGILNLVMALGVGGERRQGKEVSLIPVWILGHVIAHLVVKSSNLFDGRLAKDQGAPTERYFIVYAAYFSINFSIPPTPYL
ncbi:UNVERIFIED_CONTAM: hypothetical protein Sindi_0532100 [Sesamum indicum]